jgi:hypothetical protein
LRKYYFFLIICCSTLFISCEENVNPFEKYQERYVFNCILRGDTSLQVATVAKTFTTGGFNPHQNTNDPFISGADVRVWYKDSVYRFYDSSIVRLDTSSYKSPMNIYLNRRFKIEPNEPIEVEIMMPDGKRLKSSTKTAGRVIYDDSSTIFIYNDVKFVDIRWVSPDIGSNYFLPKFSIIYFKKAGNQNIRYIKEVPLKYENNQPVPFMVSKMPLVKIDINTIKQAFKEISDGVSDKASISVVLHPEFLVAAFDDVLSKYYSTSSESFSSLTVTLDETDYSNIQGGYGVFGSFTSTEYMQLKFSRGFITSFGYSIKE